MTTLDTLEVKIAADASSLRSELNDASRMAQTFGRTISGALEGAALRGGRLSDVVRGLAEDLSRITLRTGLKPLESQIGNVLGSAVGGLTNLFSGLSLTPMAKGGVLDAPALFPLARGGLGLAGEAGPEAVLPLTRGPDGRLGVSTPGRVEASNVTINISTPDAESFRRSESQVSALLSRALARGQRNL